MIVRFTIPRVKRPSIFYAQPNVVVNNFYEELQKNEWARLIGDDTRDLTELISIKSRRRKGKTT